MPSFSPGYCFLYLLLLLRTGGATEFVGPSESVKDGVEVVSSEQHKMSGGLENLRFVYEVCLSLGKNGSVGIKL